MPLEAVGDLWWKNAVVYCLDVETFLDTNGDGIGDFRGLTARMGYLSALGVDGLWLMPFHPSAHRDDGYDVIDYYSVDPRLGDLGEFTECIRTARAHGIKVIIDLVVNHTSDQHPWFQEARSDPDSPHRSWYVWRDEPPADWAPQIIFPGEQVTNWTFDEVAGKYYLHHFYSHQPDLNAHDPGVQDEIAEVMAFWIQQGISGFRVDAVPYMVELHGGEIAESAITPHELLRNLHAFLGRRNGEAILLGEVNLDPYEQVKYFGDEDELHLAFNFYLNQHLFLALARRDPDAIRKTLQVLPPLAPTCQWGNFLKNHDELTLDKLTASEREEVFAAFGPQKGMQLFGRGLRRRIPTMLGGDPALIRLAYSLMFSMPGTPVLFYGEEIGMGENLRVKGRLAVRTPMQWLPSKGGGFSHAEPARFVRPMPGGDFGPERVNVADQRMDADSLLHWMEHLTRRRRATPEFGLGECRVVDARDAQVLAHAMDWEGRVVIALHNFSDRARTVDITEEIGEDVVELRELWGDQPYGAPEPERVRINGHGYRWIRVVRRGQEILL